MAGFPDYEFTCSLKEDPNWEGYFNSLFPEPVQLRSLQNRWVLHELSDHGDLLTVPRPVAHWIYFKTRHDRDAYWNKVNANGFELVAMETIESEAEGDEYPYMLHITRVDDVGFDCIDECVLPLWELAIEYNGNYDGWETALVVEDPDEGSH
jgi:regulator of RNase E activity RraB